MRVERATRYAEREFAAGDVEIISAAAGSRFDAGGPGFGALVHAVLAATLSADTIIVKAADADAVNAEAANAEALNAEAVNAETVNLATSNVEDLARMHARVLGCSPEDATAAAARVTAAFTHDFFIRVKAAKQVRCESPVTHRLPDGTMIEGVIDLAFEESDGWVIADFKTDREIESRLDVYRRQVALYVNAIHALTGRPARGVLVRV